MDENAIRQVFDAARASVGVHKFGPEHSAAVLPDGFKVTDLRPFLPPPPRPVEVVTMLTPGSFCQYVGRYGTKSTVIFADETRGVFTAVLDYHNADGQRGTCDHVVRYTCPLSPEWQAWVSIHGKMQPQETFARFIEANLPDIVTPTPADMLQIALSLSIKKSAAFSSDLRLGNGQTQLRYEETIRGTTKAGDLFIPDQIKLVLPVFLGGDKYPLTAHLRYRLDETKLVMGIELIRHDALRQQAIAAVTQGIGETLKDLPLFVGCR